MGESRRTPRGTLCRVASGADKNGWALRAVTRYTVSQCKPGKLYQYTKIAGQDGESEEMRR